MADTGAAKRKRKELTKKKLKGTVMEHGGNTSQPRSVIEQMERSAGFERIQNRS